ncbi:MAG: hypothetical protein WC324_06755 [Candidatus Omnitrophota bacterium]|jgi:hypothetical protein
MSKHKKIREPARCRCGYTWTPRRDNPERCPKCGTTAWRTPAPVPPQEARTEAPPSAPIIQEVREELAPVPRVQEKEQKKQEKKGKKDRTPGKFSERHPAAYDLASNILPRSPILLFLIGLTFSALSSMIIGNYLFVMDWYRGTIILPWFMGIFTYAGGPGEWFADYWPLLTLLICLMVSVTFAFWSLPWRFAFKDYIVIRGNTKSRDGRIMWSTDNIWVRIWDGIYGTPSRDTVEIWLKHRFWWNPLMPQKGLIKLTLDRDIEKPQYEGLFQYTAEERRYRMFTAFGEMITTDDAQQSRPIPIVEINAAFAARSSSLVRDTQKFSLANPSVRIEKLRHGTHIVPDDLREVAELARKVRGE